MIPCRGDDFRVGTNYSSQVRKIASVDNVMTMFGKDIVAVTDEYGYRYVLNENPNNVDNIRWFSVD